MNKTPFYETTNRGTPDFPIGFYHVDFSHPCYQMRAQWHNEIEIERVLKGRLTLSLGNKTYEMRQNQSVILPPGVIHSAEADGCVYECIVFSPSVLFSTQRVRSQIKKKLLKPVFFCDNKNIEELFGNLKKPCPEYEIKVIAELFELVFLAVKEQENGVECTLESDISRIKDSIRFIEENYYREITLEQLSSVCSLSPNYFCHLFKEATGQTPTQYITAYRIENACNKLLLGSSVTEVAFACGFNNLSYFIHTFSTRMGVSPKQYLKAQNNR